MSRKLPPYTGGLPALTGLDSVGVGGTLDKDGTRAATGAQRISAMVPASEATAAPMTPPPAATAAPAVSVAQPAVARQISRRNVAVNRAALADRIIHSPSADGALGAVPVAPVVESVFAVQSITSHMAGAAVPGPSDKQPDVPAPDQEAPSANTAAEVQLSESVMPAAPASEAQLRRKPELELSLFQPAYTPPSPSSFMLSATPTQTAPPPKPIIPRPSAMPSVFTEPAKLPIQVPSRYIAKCRVLYDYTASKSDELSMVDGDVVYVTHKNADGWWEGMKNGEIGLFPGNYVEEINETDI